MAVNSDENWGNIEKDEERAHYLVDYCFFKENEDENLSRLCSHYLKYAIEFPAKFFLETLFLVLDIPQFDKSSYL